MRGWKYSDKLGGDGWMIRTWIVIINDDDSLEEEQEARRDYGNEEDNISG